MAKDKEKTEQQRTLKQNKALHLFFGKLADEMNTQGLDMRMVLKPTYQIWWTPESVKNDLWRPLQKAMFQKDSTADLNTAQIDKVFEQLSKILGEKWGTFVEFPSYQQLKEYLSTYEKNQIDNTPKKR